MVTVDVDKAISEINSKLSGLSSRQLDKVASRAINKSLRKGRTEARRAVKDIYNIPRDKVYDKFTGINVVTSKPSFLEGYIKAGTNPISFYHFSPKFETPFERMSVKGGEFKRSALKRRAKSPSKGVSIEVYKGKREVVPFAFMVKKRPGQAFARGQYKDGGAYDFIRRHKRINKTGADLPITRLVSISVYNAVKNENVMNKLDATVKPYFIKTMEHEIKFELSKVSL